MILCIPMSVDKTDSFMLSKTYRCPCNVFDVIVSP